MDFHVEQNKPNNNTKVQSNSNSADYACNCDICTPKSWAILSKHLDAEIARAERTRILSSVIPGGCFGPRAIKARYKEIREMHKHSTLSNF